MALALQGVIDGSLTRAAEFVVEFAPVLFLVCGILLAMTVLLFVRDFFGGGGG